MSPTSAAPAPPKGLVPLLVLITTVASVVSSLGAPLLPTIARTDHVSLGAAQWSLTVTILVGAVASPLVGRLGDGPARRSVIRVSLGLVILGSVLAALPAGGFVLLITGRAMHGFGLALMPLTMAVARDALPEERSGPAIALLSISGAAGVGLGYPVTGLLDETLGLHAAFWFGAVVAGLALVLSLPVLPDSSHLERRRLDVVGAALLGIALAATLLAVTDGQRWGWTSPGTVALLAAGGVTAGAWVRYERRCSHPIVDLRLLRHPVVATTNAIAVLIGVAMYMLLPLITDFVQTPRSHGYGFGASVLVTGLMLLPFSIVSTSMSRVAATLGARIGPERVVTFGTLVIVGANLTFVIGGGALWEGFLALGIAGIGLGCTFAAMPGLIVRSVPAAETGSALGFYQVARYVGFAIGSAVSASILSGFTKSHAAFPARTGFTVALIVGAAICLLAAAVNVSAGRGRAAPAVHEAETDIVQLESSQREF